MPLYDELIFVANARSRSSDPRLPHFLAALERGTVFLINHPDEAFALFIKALAGARRRAEPSAPSPTRSHASRIARPRSTVAATSASPRS